MQTILLDITYADQTRSEYTYRANAPIQNKGTLQQVVASTGSKLLLYYRSFPREPLVSHSRTEVLTGTLIHYIHSLLKIHN